MRRRHFLTASAGLGAAALGLPALAGSAARSEPLVPAFEDRQRPLRYALKLGMVQLDGTLEEQFGALRAMGFDGVEPDSPSNLNREELLAASRATGLAIPGVVDSVHWRDTFADPDAAVRERARAALEVALRDAAALGASTVLVVPAVVSPRIPYDDAFRRSREEIGQLVPLAEELGVTIAFENVWNKFLLSPLEARNYVDSFESKNVGWYLDLGNLIASGWPESWLRILGKRVVKLDVKDFSRGLANDQGLWHGFDTKIGDGDCDWPAIGAAIDEVGYSGWASAEVAGGGAVRLGEVLVRMHDALQAPAPAKVE